VREVVLLAVEVAVELENLAAQRHQVEELADFERAVEVLLARREVAHVPVTAGDVEVRRRLLRDGRRGGRLALRALVAGHAAQPAQRLAEVAANPGGCPQVVRDEPGVVAVAALFSRLQGGAELPLGLSPLAEGDEAQAARVPALRPHDRVLVGEGGGAVEVGEGGLAVAAPSRERGERVQRLGLALAVSLLVQEGRGAVE
jgi:hypothetical protein